MITVIYLQVGYNSDVLKCLRKENLKNKTKITVSVFYNNNIIIVYVFKFLNFKLNYINFAEESIFLKFC